MAIEPRRNIFPTLQATISSAEEFIVGNLNAEGEFFFYLQDGGFPFDSFQLPKKSGLTMVYGRYKYTYIMGFANHGAPSCGRSCVMLETGCVRRVAPSNKREYKRESPRVDAAVYSSILCKSIVSGWNTSEILVISHWRFTLCIQA